MRWCLCQVRVDILGNLNNSNAKGISNGIGNSNCNGIGNGNGIGKSNGNGNGIGNGKDDTRKQWSDWFGLKIIVLYSRHALCNDSLT